MFGPKPWIKPFGKVSILGLFEVLVFIAQTGVFFVLEYRKRHFPCLYWLKRKVGKIVIFGPKPSVNPFGIMCILQLFKVFCFYSLKRHFFVLEYRKRHFAGPYCLKRKVGKMAIFGPKHGLTPLEKCQFFDFLNFLFLLLRTALFRSRIS